MKKNIVFIALAVLAVIMTIWLIAAQAEWYITTVICLFLALCLAATFSSKADRIASNLETATAKQPFKGVALLIIACSIYATYASLMWIHGWPLMRDNYENMDERWVFALFLVLAIAGLLPFLRLFKVSGIPFDPESQKQARNGALALVVLSFVILYLQDPREEFFNGDTGTAQVMYNPVTGSIDRNRSPEECEKRDCYDEHTGHKLVPLPKEVVVKKGGWFWNSDKKKGAGVQKAGYTSPCGGAETELIGSAWKKFKTPRPGCRLSFYMATEGGPGEIRINGDPSTSEKLVWGEDGPNLKGKNLRFIEVRLVDGRPFEFTVARHPSR